MQSKHNQIWDAFIAEFGPFWEDILTSGDFEEHTAENHATVLGHLSRFKDSLIKLPEPAPEDNIVSVLKTCVEALNSTNEQADCTLLETDEREMIVGYLIDAVSAKGLDLEKFQDGDPTYAFRAF